MRRGIESLLYQYGALGGGRPAQVTPRQKRRWVALIAAGPLVGGARNKYERMHEDPRDYFEPFLEFADCLSDQ